MSIFKLTKNGTDADKKKKSVGNKSGDKKVLVEKSTSVKTAKADTMKKQTAVTKQVKKTTTKKMQ